MERLGLHDRRKDLVDTLSGGLRRRVEIAKALLHRPQVLLMDEASTGLDPAARRELSQPRGKPARAGRRHDPADHATFWRRPTAATAWCCCTRERSWRRAVPRELRSRIGGDVVVLESGGIRSRSRPASRQRFRLSPAGARRAGARRDRQRTSLHRRSGGGVPGRGGFGGPAQALARRRICARNGGLH